MKERGEEKKKRRKEEGRNEERGKESITFYFEQRKIGSRRLGIQPSDPAQQDKRSREPTINQLFRLLIAFPWNAPFFFLPGATANTANRAVHERVARISSFLALPRWLQSRTTTVPRTRLIRLESTFVSSARSARC